MPTWICPFCRNSMDADANLIGQTRPCRRCGEKSEVEDCEPVVPPTPGRPKQGSRPESSKPFVGLLGFLLKNPKLVFVVILLVVGMFELASNKPNGIVLCAVAGFIVLTLIAPKGKPPLPSHCTLCGNVLKRTARSWKMDDTEHWLCSHCNERMEREKSAQAFRKLKSNGR